MVADIFGVDGVIVLVVVLVLLFGGAAIPKLARNLGSAKNEFERGLQTGKEQSANQQQTPQQSTAKTSDEAGPVTPT
jgi:sec-independent protein translocase protein TatA